MRKAFVIFLLPFYILSIAQSSPPRELHFNHLGVENGLPENSGSYLLKDKEGYMWVGTQNGLVRFDGYTTRKYELMKDLGSVVINLLHEDKKKRLWAVFDSGLYRYDYAKDTFVYFDLTPGITHSLWIIRYMQTDDEDRIWLIFYDNILQINSLWCFNTKTNLFSSYNKKQKGNHYINCNQFNDIVIDNNNVAWVATDYGLLKYQPAANSFKKYILPPSADAARIGHLYWDPLHPQTLWMAIGDHNSGDAKGIGRYDMAKNTLHVFRHIKNNPSSISADTAYAVITDSKQQLWMATVKGLSLYHPETESFSNYLFSEQKAPSTDQLVDKVWEDKAGNFWCRAEKGLMYFNTHTKTFIRYLHNEKINDGLLNDYISGFLVDGEETVWVGGWLWGVQWLNKNKSKFTLYKKNIESMHYFPGGRIKACAEDSKGNLWLGSEHGLYKWQPLVDTFTSINFTAIDTRNVSINAVLLDREGLLWVAGTYDEKRNVKGLYCYNIKTGKVKNYRYNEKNSNTISENYIRVLHEDKSGTIWIGTEHKGVCSFDKVLKRFRRYPSGSYHFPPKSISDSLDQEQVRSITSDKEGIVWVGTNLGGVNQFFAKTQQFLSYKNNLPGLFSIVSLYCDSQGKLWAGSHKSGLFCFDKQHRLLQKYSERTRLLYDGVWGMAEDADRNLWLSSPRGFTIFSRDKLIVRTITKANGLPETPSTLFFKMKDGRMLYSCKDGFVVFNPEDYKQDTAVPLVHIETLVVNEQKAKNRMVDSIITKYGKKLIHLKHNQNRIIFNYVGLFYQNTAQVQYKYKLSGYDNNWVNASTQRSLTYSNLAPGTYTFHVTAANGDSVWSKKEDSITITIAPPFWQTWWFRTLVILAIVALILLAVRSYLNRKLRIQRQEFEKLKAIEKVRSKISMDIHDEISSGLTKISLLSQRVKNKLDNHKEIEPVLIDKIAGSSKEVISNLSEIIWAVNPKHDNLQSLLAYLRNYISVFFDQTGIENRICFPDEPGAIIISPEVKHNLFLVIKESLNNIVKHAQATQVDICFDYTNSTYCFTISDNGRGIESGNSSVFGNGLTNMKKRMEGINGNIAINAENGKGTRILLEGKFDA